VTNLEKLRNFVSDADNYAEIRHDNRLHILQEYKDEAYVTVGLYQSNNINEDPKQICTLNIIKSDVPFSCIYHVDVGDREALIQIPSDLFRLLAI